MDIPKSTVKEPLKFFQWILDYNNFVSYNGDFFRGYEVLPDAIVDYEKESVSYWNTTDDGNENPIEYTEIVYFKDIFSKCLYNGLSDFIQNLNEAVDVRFLDDSHEKFLQLLQLKIQEIAASSKVISREYPFVESYINRISEQIKKKKTAFSSNKDHIIIESSPKEECNNNDKDLVLGIFSFLKEKNQHGQKIMSDSDYKRLIDGIRELIKKESAPEIGEISEINIPLDLLTYCFYILHKILYGVKPQRKYLLSFLKNTFPKLSEWEEDTLKTNFSKKPHRKDDAYIPEIVKLHIHEKT